MFAENVRALYNPNALGDAATVNGVPVNGKFDDGYDDPTGAGYVAAFGPTFECPAADVAGIRQGATVVVRGTTFKVRNIEPDGSGNVVLLKLEEQ